ncbi:MAG: class I SAM-dependent methyltransferase, partial [Planctomycetaceae bacterium]
MCSRAAHFPLLFVLLSSLTSLSLAADEVSEQAAGILRESGVQGGFVVHLGAGTAELTAALRASTGFQVQGLEADAALVAAGRRRMLDAGQYGEVSLLQFSGQELPYIDNMVNLLVVEGNQKVPQDELLRVLVPGGT